MRNDNRTDALVKADNFTSENNVNKLPGIKWTDGLRIKKFIVNYSQIIANLALNDHRLHKVLHRCAVLMIYLHMLCLVVYDIGIKVRKFLLRKCILVVQIHKNRLRNQVITLEIHTLYKALVKTNKLQRILNCIAVEPVIFIVKLVCTNQKCTDASKHLNIFIFVINSLKQTENLWIKLLERTCQTNKLLDDFL